MGGASSGLSDCCTSRSDRSLCGLNDSFLGEDAFYRDAFYDCNEGNTSHDGLFAKAREQVSLKMRKASVAGSYAAFTVRTRSGVGDALQACMKPEPSGNDGQPQSAELRTPKAHAKTLPSVQSYPEAPRWLNSTMDEWTSPELPPTGQGPYWAKGHGDGFRVRSGPDYRKRGQKTESSGSMYQAISCDAIRGSEKLTDIIMGHCHGKLPPAPKFPESDKGGGPQPEWTTDCPLPRVICINLMLPYTAGIVPMRKDAGCSFVGFFHITAETVKAALSAEPPPAVRLFKEFWQGPAGAPGGPADSPDRSLFARVNPKQKKDQQRGLFKCIAHCLNPQDVKVPEMFHTYNGKPCLITKCGYIVKDPNLEWMEIGIDVRGFNILARKMLTSFRQLLPRTKIHYGFLIQGVDDEDMPEGILCDMFVHGCNMMEDPVLVDDDQPCSLAGVGSTSSQLVS
mmetsp:Transcript_108591/g.312855  ORF Transcript_108591/g.312855 Transcript_108591/m.312855 type:complete len:453 (+) Transcript_108591:102-1460(+)